MALNAQIGKKEEGDNYYFFFLFAMDPFYNQALKLWELIT
jgi:hypothetical protein